MTVKGKERKRAGLRETNFVGPKDGEPQTIAAHADCIQVHFFEEGDDSSRILTLRPKHIARIVEMANDWWPTRWAELYEEDPA